MKKRGGGSDDEDGEGGCSKQTTENIFLLDNRKLDDHVEIAVIMGTIGENEWYTGNTSL